MNFRLERDQATKISQPISYDNRGNPSRFPRRSTSASPFQHQRARGRRRLTGAPSRLRPPTRTRERGKVTEGLERSPRRAVRPSGRGVTGDEGRGPLLRPGILAGWKRPVNAAIYLRLEPLENRENISLLYGGSGRGGGGGREFCAETASK